MKGVLIWLFGFACGVCFLIGVLAVNRVGADIRNNSCNPQCVEALAAHGGRVTPQ